MKTLRTLALTTLLAACGPAALEPQQTAPGTSTEPLVAQGDPDRYLVKFRAGEAAEGRSALSVAGAEVLLELGPQNAVAARIPAAAVQGLSQNAHVELVEQDVPRYPMAQSTPYGIPMVQADQVWGSTAGAGRKVCIIDSGLLMGRRRWRASPAARAAPW